MENTTNSLIRVAVPDDAEHLLEIYAPYIQKTAITFEYDVPSVSEFRKRIEHILTKHPYIVIEENHELMGYAYAAPFIGRSACDWAAETTIYLKENQRKMGFGKKLYQALESISKAQNITNLNASIAYTEQEDEYLTKNSVHFHSHLGYQTVGMFHKCGYKFGRWYNLIWMEKMIGTHDDTPLPVIAFPKLDTQLLEKLGILGTV